MTKLHLKNSYSNRTEPFTALDPAQQQVTMYTCGPTVYSYAHIGNFRSFLVADVLRRVLEQDGYVVHQVMNITDVGHMTEDHLADAQGEDKLAKAAREHNSDPWAVAAHYEAAFVEDAISLRLRNYMGAERNQRAVHPRATRHIPEMLSMIQSLIDNGHAYIDAQGQVYFEIATFPEYGTLSGKNIDALIDGARIDVRHEKRDPRDFALWKVDPKHLMQWDPHTDEGWEPEDVARFKKLRPQGVDPRIKKGFPGWHIECSAMAQRHLGETIDIHTGGEDNIFPHHECEVAQCYGANGATVPAPEGDERKTFARFWLHARFLLVDGKKMSKRDGTFMTVRDLIAPRENGRDDIYTKLQQVGFPEGKVSPQVLRFALIAHQFGQPLNFTFDALVQANANVERLQSLFERVTEQVEQGNPETKKTTDFVTALAQHTTAFKTALHNNLNMPNALAAVFACIKDANQRQLSDADAKQLLAFLHGVNGILDVLDTTRRAGIITKKELERRLANPADIDELELSMSSQGEHIERLIVERERARRAKDFTRADAIREQMQRLRVLIEDTPAGVRWRYKGD